MASNDDWTWNALKRVDIACLGKTLLFFAQAIVPTAFSAVWTVYSPGWKDTVKFVSGRSWSHSIRKFADEVEDATPNWFTKTGKWFSTTLPFLDATLWWMAVIDGEQEFLTRWVSMSIGVKPCGDEKPGVYGKSKIPIDGRPGNLEWQNGPAFLTEEGDIGTFMTAELNIPKGNVGYFACFAIFKGILGGDPLGVTMELRDEWDQVLDSDIFDGVDEGPGMPGPGCFAKVEAIYGDSVIRCRVKLNGPDYPLVWFATSGSCYQGVFPLSGS